MLHSHDKIVWLSRRHSHSRGFRTRSGGVYMTPGQLSSRSEFTPVPSHGSIFVYMIPPQNVMPA